MSQFSMSKLACNESVNTGTLPEHQRVHILPRVQVLLRQLSRSPSLLQGEWLEIRQLKISAETSNPAMI